MEQIHSSLSVYILNVRTKHPERSRQENTLNAVREYYAQNPNYVEWGILEKVKHASPGCMNDEIQAFVDTPELGNQRYRKELAAACKKNKCSKCKCLGVKLWSNFSKKQLEKKVFEFRHSDPAGAALCRKQLRKDISKTWDGQKFNSYNLHGEGYFS